MRVDGDAPLIRDTRFRSAPSFVGRQADLELLEGCLHDALTGKPGVVLLSGDAGQGKTRLLHELESRAASEHFHVCRGRAHEDLSFPYLPFLDVLRSQISEVPEVVQRVLGPDAERIEALLRGESWSGFEEELEHGRGGRAGRMTLFTSVSRATVDLARIRPTLLVLDDLHWADGSTIEQLLHLVFAVADAMRRERIPLLVVASSRPPEPDGLLERAIARIEREDLCTSLALRGLGEDEVSELVAGLISAPPARHLVNELRTLTRGNPLFIQEVVDHLVDQEALSEQGGFVVLGRDVDDLELPRDLLSALEARAGTVSRQCRELLALAACLGDHFTLPILTALTKRDEDDLLDDLEAAAAAHLLLWRDETFHFRHPLVRHVFYGMPNPARRQRVHRRIAAHLQTQYPAGASERALEIGHHLVRAGSLTPPDQGAHFAELAGDLSFGRCAWRDAARFYAAAAAAAARLEPPAPATVAKLHLRAGVAHYRNMDLGPCFEHLDRAIERLEQGPLQRELVQARVERLRAQLTPGWSPWDQLADVEPLEQILERLGEDELAQRGQAAAILSDAYWTAGQYEQGEAWAREAIRIGHELGDDLLCSQALVALGMAQAERLRLGDSLATLQEALELSRRGGDLWLAGHPLQRLPLVLTSLGRLSEAEPHAEEGCRATRTIQDWAEHSLSLATRVVIAVARGRFEEAERDCEEVVAIAGRSHYPWGAAIAIAAVCSAQVMVGRYQEAERGIDRLAMPGVVFQEAGPAIEFLVRVYRELVGAMQGSRAETGEPPAISLLARPDAEADLQTLGLFCAGVEIAARREDADLAARCYAPIAAASERGALLSNNWSFLVPRVLGVAARLNGWWERGAAHFEHALRAASEAGAEPEYARACLDYAQLLHQRRGPGDLEAAVELVERASPRFEGLGMHPFENETAQLAAKLGLRPEAASVEARIERPHPLAPPSTPRVLLVTDMQGFTNLLDRLGDQAVETLLDHHNQILRACLHDHRGREIQHTGDGFILSFDAAGNALGCAIAMQKDLARYNARHPDTPIRIREGLHAGKALPVEDRLLGAAVNAAVRICSTAEPGEILISDTLLEDVQEAGIVLRDRGLARLKGFAESFRLHEVIWGEEGADSTPS